MRRTSHSIAVVLALALVVVLAPRPARAASAWVSTNGLIAFRSDRDGDPEVFTMDATGGAQTNLSDNATIGDTTPAWSPEGTRLAYVRKARETGRPDLFVMDSKGRGRTRLTSTP